ncbi:MAG: gliding motility-associated C-terminal domain-containing protein [Bacteroidales bacterium]|nr:gliding motility-associated C-terminal domain-containing protein [Bacteroidales bacterium]NLK82230.1 hypothetical protein [Bacteroidales bacterium]
MKQIFCFLFVLCIANSSLCFSQSIDPPEVQFVSVNPYTNQISVAWNASSNTNVAFTRVHYVYDKSTIIKGQTVEDIYENADDTLIFSTSSYPIFTKQANEAPLSFAVDVYTTTNENSITLDKYHTTCFLSNTTYECAGGINLSWTAYEGDNVSVTAYEIIEVVDANTEIVIGNVASSQREFLVPHTHMQLRRFFVRVYIKHTNSALYVSTSNLTTSEYSTGTYPTFLDIETMHVDTAQNIILYMHCDSLSDFSTYLVERSFQNRVHFVAYDTIYAPKHASHFSYVLPHRFYVDSLFFYRLHAIDDCGTILTTTAIVNPMQLYVQDLSPYEHLLSWHPGLMWSEEYDGYRVVRITNATTETYIAELSVSEEVLLDEITDYAIDPKICYRIDAFKNRENKALYTNSNYACVYKESSIFFPNAFNPQSAIEENRVFKPKFAYIAGTYNLQIYSRNGSMIFESTSIEKGWDGTINKKMAAEGSYLYTVIIEMPSKKTIHKTGAVMLLLHD